MKKLRKLSSVVLTLILTLGCLSVGFEVDADAAEIDDIRSKTQDRSYNFSTDYKLTGNPADDLVAVAQAQIGKTTYALNYTEDWCANFANDCARLTGMPDNVIPYNYGLRASCYYMYQYMVDNCGAKVISDERDIMSGDLVFYVCPTSNFYLHVGIVENPEHYLEGNYGEKVQRMDMNYKFSCYIHYGSLNNTDTGHVKRVYVRPNYKTTAKKLYSSTNPNDYSKPSRTLSNKEPVPSCGFEVCWVQAVLCRLGYLNSVNGVFDGNTAVAVRNFQKSCGIEQNGTADSKTVEKLSNEWNNAIKPKITNFKSNKSTYEYNDNITLSAEIKNADSTELTVSSGSRTVIKASNISSYIFNASEIGEGNYTAYFTAKNSFGTTKSSAVQFKIEKKQPSAAELNITAGTTYKATVVSWNKSENTDSYDIYIIDKSSNTIYASKKNFPGTKLSVLLPAGKYEAYAVSKNENAQVQSSRYDFSVASGTPVNLGGEFYARISFANKNTVSISANEEAGLAAKSDNSVSQIWYFKKQSDNSYTLTNCESGKMLTRTVEKLTMTKVSTSVTKRWFIVECEGKYMLLSELGNSVIALNGSSLVSEKSYDSTYETLEVKKVSAVHNYELDSIVKPTSSKDGYAVYHCIICGDSLKKSVSRSDYSNIVRSEYRIGDVDGDGEITSNDAVLIQRASIGINDIDSLDRVLGDIDCDGVLTTLDSITVLRSCLRLENNNKIGTVVDVS